MNNKLDGLSMDLENANMEKLKAVFPECFSEGKLVELSRNVQSKNTPNIS